MALLNYTTKELDQMARLMRAEAVGEGELGMLMVGNVIVNRAISNCLTFKNINTIEQVIFQNPGGFSGINSDLFYSSATTLEKELARRNLEGETYYPATHALWFYSPSGIIVVFAYGMIRNYQADIKSIVFINHTKEFVQNYINIQTNETNTKFT